MELGESSRHREETVEIQTTSTKGRECPSVWPPQSGQAQVLSVQDVLSG